MPTDHCYGSSERRALLDDLQLCLRSADLMKLHLVGIHISSAIHFLEIEEFSGRESSEFKDIK